LFVTKRKLLGKSLFCKSLDRFGVGRVGCQARRVITGGDEELASAAPADQDLLHVSVAVA